MRLAFLFGPMSVGRRPLDFSRIEEDPRGLTGTDNSFLGYAAAMAARGHEVAIFVARQRTEAEWAGCRVYPHELRRVVDGTWDAALSWTDISPLMDVSPDVLRVLDTQIANYSYTKPEQHRAVDLYLMPSGSSARRLEPLAREQGGTAPVMVLPNGCDPDAYDLARKVPGRCVWASSPDRGLHVVAEAWPEIRRRVPEATLRIFYHGLEDWIADAPRRAVSPDWRDREHARRARIVAEHLSDPGVEVVGSVSRRRMARELSEAMVLTGPQDTISYTETFCVAALEGCASGAVPCLSTCDCLGEVFAGAAPLVSVEDSHRRFLDPAVRRAWTEDVVSMLTPGPHRDYWVARGRAFAARHAWPVLGARLEEILAREMTRKWNERRTKREA